MSTAPVILAGQAGFDHTYTIVFADEFDTDGAGPGQYWSYDVMDDALNRTGNEGQDEDGNLASGSVNGKRWSAWANGPNDEFVYRSGGQLYIGGKVEDAADPTRESYTIDGTFYNWANTRWYAPYMVQWGRVFDNDVGDHVTDTNTPNIYFGPGHFVEIRISVEEMRARGFRVSLWLTPIIPNESNAYDADAANGVEIDILEIENWIVGGYANGRVQSKVLGGDAGSTIDQGGGNVDLLNDHGIDIRTGFHTYGLLWKSDGLYWLCDGKEYILDIDRVPQTNHYLSLTREINAGVYDGASGTQIPSNGVKRPQDIGIYGVSAFLDKDEIEHDKAIVDYIRVWSVDGEGGVFNGSNVDGSSVDPIDGSVIPDYVRTNTYIGGVDRISPYQSATFHPELPETDTNPANYTYSWSISGSASVVIVGATDQYLVRVRSTDGPLSNMTFNLSCDINAITDDPLPQIVSVSVGGGFSNPSSSPTVGTVAVSGAFTLS